MIDLSSAGSTHEVLSRVSTRDIHQGSPPAGGVMQTHEGTITFKCEGCGVRKPEAERYRPTTPSAMYRNSIHLPRADHPSPTHIAGQLTTHQPIWRPLSIGAISQRLPCLLRCTANALARTMEGCAVLTFSDPFLS